MEETNYPLPSFHFEVRWSAEEKEAVPFTEVSGLSVENQVIEYREGNSKVYSTIKMPGLKKYGNVTLKRGAMAKDNSLFDWWNKAQLNKIERKNVVINLLDELHEPVITWTLQNAFPVKVDNANYNSTSNEVLIETIELAHEGLTLSRPKAK
ncbi:phage tail protein [Porphyromonas endodontalis]|uniref:phage tail protein n=1 Tax=Porphyromonas endodontalis TaxID=28124 RepID=UPI0028E66569|nr:phage tail protein [Porphyromonas endodontalis]